MDSLQIGRGAEVEFHAIRIQSLGGTGTGGPEIR
jgi:hypothetical protein